MSYGRIWCRGRGSNPHGGHPPQDFKSCASACSATPACHTENWSGRRDSNPRPQPWQGCILPLNYFRKTCLSYFIKSAGEGSRTPTPKALDPKSSASANSATPAYYNLKRKMGRLMGIEPTSAGATIRCVNHFATTAMIFWCRLEDLNPQPTDYKSVALPIELSRLNGGG